MENLYNNADYKDGCGFVYNCDVMELMGKIEDESVDLIVTDPPYKIISGGCRIKAENNECGGIFNRRIDNKKADLSDNARSGKMFDNNNIKFSDWLPNCFRILKTNTHFYVMVNDRNMQEMLNEATKVGFQIVNILVWKKNNCTPNKFYMKNGEFILMFRKGGQRWINNMGTKTIIEIENPKNKQHPSEKPIELMKIFIENSTQPNEIVFEPFAGVMTTPLACKEIGRRYIACEIDKNYFDIGCDKLVNYEIQ